MEWVRIIERSPADGAEVLLSRDDGLRVVATFRSGRGRISQWCWPSGRNAECVAGDLASDGSPAAGTVPRVRRRSLQSPVVVQ